MNNTLLDDMENYVVNRQSATLTELSEHFKVCMNTVRKYANILAQKEYITKYYGGIRVDDSACTPISSDARSTSNVSSKECIARKAASFIQSGDILFIDSGTTTRGIPKYIPQNLQCTIITQSFYIIETCVKMPNIQLIVLPGLFYSRSYAFVDTISSEFLKSFNFTKAFMGCTGFSLEKGATNSTPLECFIKSAAIETATEIFLLADHSKINVSSLLTYAKAEQITHLITDQEPPESYTDAFARNGQTIHLSDSQA